MALDAEKTAELKLDEAEELEVRLLDLNEVPAFIRKGGIRHALVVAAFHFLGLFLEENPGKV